MALRLFLYSGKLWALVQFGRRGAAISRALAAMRAQGAGAVQSGRRGAAIVEHSQQCGRKDALVQSGRRGAAIVEHSQQCGRKGAGACPVREARRG